MTPTTLLNPSKSPPRVATRSACRPSVLTPSSFSTLTEASASASAFLISPPDSSAA